MDLSTNYLGLALAHPIMPGASPLVDDLDTVRRLEDAGASAIVMHSLFEEQILQDELGSASHIARHAEAHAEALSYFPQSGAFALGPDLYLEQVRRIKMAVKVPVIASLNGVTAEGWLEHARLIQEAGADALELNVYHVATDPQESGATVENRVVEILQAVKAHVTIPVAVKLSPFFSSVAHLAQRLDQAKANGLVLFNRFYQPDFDVETLDVHPRLHLSESSELPLRLHWLSILAGRVRASLAVSGGVHSPSDAVKAVMAGAHAVQMVSALLLHGPERLRVVRDGLAHWMEEHGYASLKQMQGSLSLERCPDPAAFERGNYVALLQTWRGRG